VVMRQGVVAGLARQPRQLGVGERTGGGRVGTFGKLGGAPRVAACAGPVAQAIAPVDEATMTDTFVAALALRYCNMRKTTIYAGSNEIQRNIIAKHALGL